MNFVLGTSRIQSFDFFKSCLSFCRNVWKVLKRIGHTVVEVSFSSAVRGLKLWEKISKWLSCSLCSLLCTYSDPIRVLHSYKFLCVLRAILGLTETVSNSCSSSGSKSCSGSGSGSYSWFSFPSGSSQWPVFCLLLVSKSFYACEIYVL